MKSPQMMRKKEDVEERKESGEEGKLESIVIPFLFHRGIKSKLAGFSMIRKNHSSVFITYYEVEERHTMSFMCLFYFHEVFVSPRQVQVFTPVKGFTQPGMRTQSFRRVIRQVQLLPPKLQRVSFLLWNTISSRRKYDYSAECFGERQRETEWQQHTR